MPKKEAGRDRSESRRRFTKAAVAALVATPAGLATAQTPPATRESKAPPAAQPTPTPAQQQQQKPSPVAEAYGELARARFGAQLKPEELERVRRGLEAKARRAESLAAYKLKNSDEPDFVFIA